MQPLFSTAGGKLILTGIVLVLAGTLAKIVAFPYDNMILVAGVAIAIAGGFVHSAAHTVPD